MINLQVYCGSMSKNGGVECLMGAMSPESGQILVAASRRLSPNDAEVRMPGAVLVTDNPATDGKDMLFTDDDVQEAISCYLAVTGRGQLRFNPIAERFNPHSKIEMDGLGERGMKYRVNPEISSGQLAVVIMCWAAVRQREVGSVMRALDSDIGATAVAYSFIGGQMVDHGGRVSHYELGGALPIGHDGWPIEPGRHFGDNDL